MPKKTWIGVKRGLLAPKHVHQIGPAIWLFLYMLDVADWETGKIYGYTDRDTGTAIGIPISTIRKQRRKLEKWGYVSCEQRPHDQTVTIHKWVNPRKYSGSEMSQREHLLSLPYDEYLLTLHWQSVRKTALKKADYKCQACSGNDTKLHVHHNSYENLGEERDSDLIVLCENCHALFHGKHKSGQKGLGAIFQKNGGAIPTDWFIPLRGKK